MKKSAVLLAFLTLTASVWASPVTLDQALESAQNWAARKQALGAKFGASVERAAALAVATNATVYAVKMSGGGTVFVAGDDAYEPIVAFTAETNDYSTIDKRSPLWALLQRDAEVRAKMAAAGVTSKTTSSAKKATVTPLTAHLSYEPSDLRVAPLVQSKWDQTAAGGKLCYNRYTPVLNTGSHATCGCVATAMSQIMRYHQFPTASRESVTRQCYVNTYAVTKEDGPDYAAFITNLTTQAGTYDWASMPLVPASGVTDEQCEAIGKLTSDAGISVNMNYGTDSYGSSGAFGLNVPKGLKETFGYANADYYWTIEISSEQAAMKRGFLANLDAGYPVQMGISGDDGGHSIVGDGYGYEDDTLYVHLNMGWSGSWDFWYNLPHMEDAGFNVFDDMVCNIFPEDAEKNALLTGRVTDDDGLPFDGVSVRVYATGTKTLVATDLTTNGVYGVRLPAGTYDVEFEKKDYPVETLSSVVVAATKSESGSGNGIIAKFDDGTRWLVPLSYSKITSLGNSYGNDVTLVDPRAQIVVGAETYLYSTLDKAIAGGAALVAGGQPSVKIELLKDIPLKTKVTIAYACELATAEGVEDAVTVTRADGASLEVAVGGSLNLHDVTFAANATMVVSVAAGGTLSLGAGVDFAVPDSVAAVQTADAAGFVMADVLSTAFTIDCAAAQFADDVFGVSLLPVSESASNSAAYVSSIYDRYGEIRGVVADDGGKVVLKWADVPVPLEVSAGYFVDASGTTNNSARLDRVFERYVEMRDAGRLDDSSEIVVRNRPGLSLSTRVNVTGDLTVRGVAGTSLVAISSWGGDAGFDIGEGATLTIKDLSLDGYQGEAFLRVTGGALNVGGVTKFANFSGTNTYSGVIAVLSGTATLGADAGGSVTISGCSTLGQGAALYLKDGACSATLKNTVRITDCSARSDGGAIYVGYAKTGKTYEYATLGLSGSIYVDGNYKTAQSSARTLNNIAVARRYGSTEAPSLVLEGALGLGSQIGLSGAGTGADDFSTDGSAFMRVADGFTDAAAIISSCRALFCDSSSVALEAEPAEDYATIRWAADDGSVKEVDPSVAVASVQVAGEPARYYGTIEDAFSVATNGATIAVLTNATFESDIVVTSRVSFVSGNGDLSYVWRTAQCKISVLEGGDLTVSNVSVSGFLAQDWYGGDGNLFDVQGGALTLADGAIVRDVATSDASSAVRADSAVRVYNGTFTMLEGSKIKYSDNTSAENNRGGGVTADSQSRVFLLGGTVTGCASDRGGGVYIGNEATVEIGGTFTATDNVASDGSANNVYVAASSSLVLVSPLTGSVGYVPGPLASTSVFGRVSSLFTGDDAELVSSARNFTHDLTGDTGIAVSPASGTGDTLLVWKGALDADGKIEIDGEEYAAVEGSDITPEPEPDPEPTVVTPTPIAFQSITKVSEADGKATWQLVVTNRVPWCWYRLLSTDDLSKGFTTTGAWEQVCADADAVWTTNVTTTTEKLFWRAEGKEGEVGE